MRVQVIYGEHEAEEFWCQACGGTGDALQVDRVTVGKCWPCMGRGSTVADQPTYTYDVPDGTKLWDVLICPTPQQGGGRGTVVKLSSTYDGPVRQAYALPTFPCKGNCGNLLTPNDPRFFCQTCWSRTPPEMRGALDATAGFKALPIVRAIADYLSVTA
jgi:hypothetical protein